MSGIKAHTPSLSRNLPNPPSLVESPHHRFLIFDAPNNDNLPLYLNVSPMFDPVSHIRFDIPKEWKKFNVHHLVRACDPTYEAEPLRAHGIDVHVCP